MNHEAAARALCGRYVQLTERSAYIESNAMFPVAGTMIGAYITEAGPNNVVVSDDGDVIFHLAAQGSDVNANRARRYRDLAAIYGIALGADGNIRVLCTNEDLPNVLGRYIQAVTAIATMGLKHRPKDEERFERLVGDLLARSYGVRVVKRPEFVGISGHQVRFPFAVDVDGPRPIVVQPVPAEDDRVRWNIAYEAGGKFKDVGAARPEVRLVAVLEHSRDTDQARRYFADAATVIDYQGGDLRLEAA
jgi:hypothetical protein